MTIHIRRTLVSATRDVMWRFVGSTLTVATFAAGVAAAQVPGSSAPVGPFTAAQAMRGKLVYVQSCAACHGAALEGAAAPSLAGRSFEARWRLPALTMDDLLYIARKTMPPKAAGTVSLEDHAAVVAYILEANGYAAGQLPLALGPCDQQRSGHCRVMGYVLPQVGFESLASALRLERQVFRSGLRRSGRKAQ